MVNRKRVARIMRKEGWSYRVRRRKWVPTTHSDHGLPIYPNLIKGVKLTDLNQLWVADITYIRIVTCFVYLAVILDAISRKAIGYCLSQRLDTGLTPGALRMAIHKRHPAPGCIHHSDCGIQYASSKYVKDLKLNSFQISMSRRGHPCENAQVESFIKSLEAEEIHLWGYCTMEDGQKRLPSFVKNAYKQKRLQSSLSYRSPSEFKAMVMLTQNPCQDTLITSL